MAHMRNPARSADGAAVLAALADPTRLAMVRLLADHQELCVCEVMDALGISQSRASRNLSMLCGAGVLCGEKRGKWMFYALAEERSFAPLLEFIRKTVSRRARPGKRRC